MPRVASLCLPDLAIDRLRLIEARAGRPPEPPTALSAPALLVPENGGWRPGARWARKPRIEKRSAAIAQSGRPLIMVDREGQRLGVAAVSEEARMLDIRPGMTLSQARAMVPGLDIHDADPAGDAALLARLGHLAALRWSPSAAVSGLDGIWFEIGGSAHLFGGEEAMARRILRFCRRIGYRAHLAIADTAGAAHALARFGDATLIHCPSGAQGDAIAPLPVAALRIDDAPLRTMRRLGIATIGDLLRMPRAPLTRRFGRAVLDRIDQATGRLAEPFAPIIPRDAPRVEQRFAEPIASPEAIAIAVAALMARLATRLEQRGLGIRLLRLDGARVDGEDQRIVIGTARATRDPAHLLRLIMLKIETIEPGYGLDALSLTGLRCEPLAPQPIDGGEGGGDEGGLATLVDRLIGRLGVAHVYRVGAVESDVPERSVRRVEPLEVPAGWPARWPRPVRLLSHPEPVDNVLADLPDLPPVRFRWRGRLHKVVRADGPERIYGEWWKRASETCATRDYFRVEDEDGARFWLFRRGDGEDGRTGDMRWYLHGLFG